MDAVCARYLAQGADARVVEVLLANRTASTYARYEGIWNKFVGFCADQGVDPWTSGIGLILSFIEGLRSEAGWCDSTVRSYASAISFYRGKIDGKTVFTHDLMAEYLSGIKKVVVRALPQDEQWDVALVLRALQDAPFEPMQTAEIKFVSAKVAVLLALTTAARVSELTALTITGITFSGDYKVIINQDPAFAPKHVATLYRRTPVVLRAYFPEPQGELETRRHLLCPVRAVRLYMQRTSDSRRTQQLLVTYGGRTPGSALSSQRLSHWLRDGIAAAYQTVGKRAPMLKAHSTRGMATSIAVKANVDWDAIRNIAGWTGDQTFMRFYYRDVESRSVAEAVLDQA